MVKRGVKTGKLGQLGKTLLKGLRQQDFLRQMFGIKRAELVKGSNHLRGDAVRFPIFGPAVDDAMADGGEVARRKSGGDPIHQIGHRDVVIRGLDGAGFVLVHSCAFDRKLPMRLADAADTALEDRTQLIAVSFRTRF